MFRFCARVFVPGSQVRASGPGCGTGCEFKDGAVRLHGYVVVGVFEYAISYSVHVLQVCWLAPDNVVRCIPNRC